MNQEALKTAEMKARMRKRRPDWLERLVSEIHKHKDQTGKSYREMSMAAGLGPNFVTQLLANDWKEPLFGNVVRLCDELHVSITYIVTGAEMTRTHETVLSRMSALPEHQQQAFLAFLHTLSPSSMPQE